MNAREQKKNVVFHFNWVFTSHPAPTAGWINCNIDFTETFQTQKLLLLWKQRASLIERIIAKYRASENIILCELLSSERFPFLLLNA